MMPDLQNEINLYANVLIKFQNMENFLRVNLYFTMNILHLNLLPYTKYPIKPFE